MLTRLPKLLPNKITNFFRGTEIDRIYDDLKLRLESFSEIKVETAGGNISLVVPEYAREWYSEGHEPILASDLTDNLTEDSVFYDIGSQFGFFIELALREGLETNQIHGFEAEYFHYRILDQQYSERAHLIHDWVGKGNDGSLSIDDYTHSNDPPDVIKIDVEGAEADILDGMKETLSDKKPLLYIEIHPNKLDGFGRSSNEIIELLEQMEYELDTSNHRNKESVWVPVDRNDENGTYLLRGK
ncbi:hypothetical protein Z052_12540 [Halorubrum sp. C191]|uniref:FkbM family methyltransferase n=1 Tax=Halorubrum sp. C191 TaxID=1383842 RepID=UPI000C077A1A|nr:FkbM family methyltransferase [Halorubrum sp. C191]PHQ41875.1 hypothetical protein Z052_12540 [Halorubrum sp. C191]